MCDVIFPPVDVGPTDMDGWVFSHA